MSWAVLTLAISTLRSTFPTTTSSGVAGLESIGITVQIRNRKAQFVTLEQFWTMVEQYRKLYNDGGKDSACEVG